MAWEDVLKRQSDLLTRVSLIWSNAKNQALTNSYTANAAANDAVNFWKGMLNLWWGPFDLGSPNIPTLLITSPPGATKAENVCQLLADAVTAQVEITNLGLIGGAATIAGSPAGAPTPLPPPAPQPPTTKTVTGGTNLKVTVNNVPAATGLYQGLALVGPDPVAVIILKVG